MNRRKIHPVIRRVIAEARKRNVGCYHGATFAVLYGDKGQRVEVTVDGKCRQPRSKPDK